MLSLYIVQLTTELQKMREVVRTMDNGKSLPETQKLVKQISEAESNLREAVGQLDTFLLRLYDGTS